MAGGPDIVALPSIAALPPTTARQIGSGQVLVDPSSVVKELIDNALDARAKSIFVDIAANTIDSIQVKDDGHGIPAEDRPLVCRRSCTSKIKDFHDLREVGGKWLGFRGEALSSMAEMSSSMCVTTRVEGEPVAVKLKYGWDGELASVEHDSHPVGTTVKVTKLFDFIPVRKQAASKNSANLLAKIRRLMQAYALARPTIRFRLRVLKAKNNNGDFVYAPRADANVKDAALKVIGKDCALQCDWTVLEADGFEVHAFLPKPGATGPKIAHRGAFVSIDARPVSSSRGTIKQIVAAYRDRLRKSNPSLAGVKDPFFCLNITCPPDSYDPNIEPAKDDVMFDNSAMVIGVVDKLLKAFYPESSQDVQDAELPTSAQHQYEPPPQQLLSCSGNSIVAPEDEPTSPIEEPLTNPMQALPRWRSSMYGIDEDDLEFLQEDPAPVFEEEEGLRAAEISNPWTIARMNTTIKTKQAVNNKQLLSPAKSRGGTNSHVESSSPAVTPRRPCSAVPLTPQTSSRMKMTTYPSDAELGCSIQQAPQPSSESGNLGDGAQNVTTNARRRYEFRTSPIHTGMSPTRGSNGTELKESLPGTQVFQPARRQKHSMINDGPRLPTKNSSIPRRPVLSAAEQTAPNQLHSIDNSDIRDFFGRIGDARGVSHTQRSLMTSINPEPSIHQLRGRSPPLFSGNVPQRNAPADGLSRASSAEPQPRSKRVRDDLQLDDDRGMIDESRDVAHRASSAGSQMSMSLDQRSTSIRDSLSAQNEHDTRLEPRKPSRSFRTYHDVFPQSPTPRLSSTRTKHPFISQQPSQTSVTPATHHPDNRAEEIEAYFRSYEQQHTSSPSHHTNASPRQGPRIALSHETPRKARRPRHRTTDALERTQSSPLALQRPPKGSDIQNLVFPLAISITAIVHCSRALDMRRNCPEWGSACEDTYGGFDERVVEKEIMAWAVKLDALLCRRYERMDGVDTRRDIHEGVRRALDTRRETSDVMLGAEGVERGIVDGGVEVFENHVFGDGGDDASVVVQQPGVNDDDCDFDMEQFVDLTVENERQGMGTAGEGGAEVVKGEYDEDIEDEMLMDL